MKIYKNQEEVNADIIDNVLTVKENVTFEFSLRLEASLVVDGDIRAGNINAWDIKAGDIKVGNINAGDINAGDINAWDINAGDINAGDINAWDINAGDINAENITARNINAWDISFYAVAFAYLEFKCKSIVGRRESSKYFCLDSEVIIKEKK